MHPLLNKSNNLFFWTTFVECLWHCIGGAVLIHGEVVHRSAANTSDVSRHVYTFHIMSLKTHRLESWELVRTVHAGNAGLVLGSFVESLVCKVNLFFVSSGYKQQKSCPSHPSTTKTDLITRYQWCWRYQDSHMTIMSLLTSRPTITPLNMKFCKWTKKCESFESSVYFIYNHNSVNKRLVFVNQRVFIIIIWIVESKKHLILLKIHFIHL